MMNDGATGMAVQVAAKAAKAASEAARAAHLAEVRHLMGSSNATATAAVEASAQRLELARLSIEELRAERALVAWLVSRASAFRPAVTADIRALHKRAGRNAAAWSRLVELALVASA